MTDGIRTKITKSTFVAMLVLANILATKIVSLPVGDMTVTAGVIPIGIAYLCSDILAEKIGKQKTKQWVTAAVITVGLSWLVIFSAINSPAAESWGKQSAFESILSASYPIVVASIIVFLISQHFDVSLFYRIRSYTGERYKWARNIGSTVTTQLLDTAAFTLLAFVVLPMVLGGTTLPLAVIAEIIVFEYAVKICIAMIDTPLFYILTHEYTTSN